MFYMCSYIAGQVRDETFSKSRPPPQEVPNRVGYSAASAMGDGCARPETFANPWKGFWRELGRSSHWPSDRSVVVL